MTEIEGQDTEQLEEQEAAEAFGAGFAEAQGKDEDDGDRRQEEQERQQQLEQVAAAKKEEQQQQVEIETPEPAPQQQSESDKAFEKISKRVRDVEGRVGGLMTKLEAALVRMETNSQTQQVPTQQEVQAALVDDKEMDEFVKEYGELKPIVSAIQKLNQKLDGLQQKANEVAPQQQITPEQITEVVETSTDRKLESARLQDAHEDWQQIIDSNDWIVFVLDGGPSINHWAAYRGLNDQDQAQVVAQWQEQYPDWWKTKGKGMFSASASEAISLLNKYKEQRQATAKNTETGLPTNDLEEQKRKQQEAAQRRLRASVMPQGTNSGEVTGALSDQQAFAAGFNEVRRRHKV